MGERMPASDCGAANTDARLAALEQLSALDQALELEYGLTGNPLAEWIPVSERLPETPDMVILADAETVNCGWFYKPVGWSWAASLDPCEPTHWMPLPEPPTVPQ